LKADLPLLMQAGARWRSFDKARQARFVQRVSEALMADRVSPEVRRIWVGYWSQCDPQMGQQIARMLQQHSML
jgi:catalase